LHGDAFFNFIQHPPARRNHRLPLGADLRDDAA
jgi:hypothetical protein